MISRMGMLQIGTLMGLQFQPNNNTFMKEIGRARLLEVGMGTTFTWKYQKQTLQAIKPQCELIAVRIMVN